jgi:hypothetical protein
MTFDITRFVQPFPKGCAILYHDNADGTTSTDIAPVWNDGEGVKCRLCPIGHCTLGPGNLCLLSVRAKIKPEDAWLFACSEASFLVPPLPADPRQDSRRPPSPVPEVLVAPGPASSFDLFRKPHMTRKSLIQSLLEAFGWIHTSELTDRFQPMPIGLQLAPAGTPEHPKTAIGRSWNPGDVERCRLCPRCTANPTGFCVVGVSGRVEPRNAALYRSDR